MDKINKYSLISFFVIIIIVFPLLFQSFYLRSGDKETKNNAEPDIKVDLPCVLPDWDDGKYHNFRATTEKINSFVEKYPNLVEVTSIGKSIQGKDIWCIRITNEDTDVDKFSCLIDGCIHGCEWEAGEACLYLSEYLLINYGSNSTIEHILNQSEIYIVPLVNPDGRDADSRFNSNGIDLCRNFDVDFGRWRGSAIRLGSFLGRLGFSLVYIPFFGYLNNCGITPFSEPETQALDNLMEKLDNNRFSFYLNCHTAIHNFFGPWSSYKPPFEIQENKQNLFDFAGKWVSENTEYENKELQYHASGTVVDWCFYKYDVPSFVLEILSKEYEPWLGGGKHDNLVHWMKTTLPIYMYLLVNIENLYNWETPDIEPSLPEGVPPNPI